jgi:hypothetical protein
MRVKLTGVVKVDVDVNRIKCKLIKGRKKIKRKGTPPQWRGGLLLG